MGTVLQDTRAVGPYLTHDAIQASTWHQLAVDLTDGAAVEFLGIVRGQEDGRTVAFLDYEAYAPMAERTISRLVEEAVARWGLRGVYVRHRVGRVAAGEIAVLIGVHAPHREQAFAACRFLIDAIKREAPIWKREVQGWALGGTAP